MNPEISIVIPCYNEEKNIPLIIERVKDIFNKDEIELVLVDNGSIDNTQNKIREYIKSYENIKLVIVKKNIGYGFGVLTGLKKAKGEFICWTHADLQTDPLDCLKALEIIKKQENPEKVYLKGNRHERPFFDKFFEFGMSIFETIILRTYLNDINAQPNLFHKSFLNLMKNPPNDFSFELYVYYLAKTRNYKIIRFPVLFPERIHGESAWNTSFQSKIKFIKRTLNFSFKLKKVLREKNANNPPSCK